MVVDECFWEVRHLTALVCPVLTPSAAVPCVTAWLSGCGVGNSLLRTALPSPGPAARPHAVSPESALAARSVCTRVHPRTPAAASHGLWTFSDGRALWSPSSELRSGLTISSVAGRGGGVVSADWTAVASDWAIPTPAAARTAVPSARLLECAPGHAQSLAPAHGCTAHAHHAAPRGCRSPPVRAHDLEKASYFGPVLLSTPDSPASRVFCMAPCSLGLTQVNKIFSVC